MAIGMMATEQLPPSTMESKGCQSEKPSATRTPEATQGRDAQIAAETQPQPERNHPFARAMTIECD